MPHPQIQYSLSVIQLVLCTWGFHRKYKVCDCLQARPFETTGTKSLQYVGGPWVPGCLGREVLEGPYIVREGGGSPPPPPRTAHPDQTKVTTVGMAPVPR